MKYMLQIFSFIFFTLATNLFAQAPTRAQLADALQQSETDLETCRQQVRSLQSALQNTDLLINRRKN